MTEFNLTDILGLTLPYTLYPLPINSPVLTAGWCSVCYMYTGQLSIFPWKVYPIIGLNGFWRLKPIVPVDIMNNIVFFIRCNGLYFYRSYNSIGPNVQFFDMFYSWDYVLNTITGSEKLIVIFLSKLFPIRVNKLLNTCFCLSNKTVFNENIPPLSCFPHSFMK